MVRLGVATRKTLKAEAVRDWRRAGAGPHMDILVTLALVFSIVAMSSGRAATPDGFIRAASVNEHVDDVRVNIEDKRTVDLVTASSRTAPVGAVHTLKINGDLSLKATLWTSLGAPQIRVELISSKNGTPRILSNANAQAYPGQSTAINFSVCGDRIIRVYGGTTTGRCADLLPMAKLDPQAGNCGGSCTGPYEGMPVVITSH